MSDLQKEEATRQREVSKARYFEMLANRVRRGDLVLEDIEVDVDGSLINVYLKIRDPKTMATELAAIDRAAAEAAEAEGDPRDEEYADQPKQGVGYDAPSPFNRGGEGGE